MPWLPVSPDDLLYNDPTIVNSSTMKLSAQIESMGLIHLGHLASKIMKQINLFYLLKKKKKNIQTKVFHYSGGTLTNILS